MSFHNLIYLYIYLYLYLYLYLYHPIPIPVPMPSSLSPLLLLLTPLLQARTPSLSLSLSVCFLFFFRGKRGGKRTPSLPGAKPSPLRALREFGHLPPAVSAEGDELCVEGLCVFPRGSPWQSPKKRDPYKKANAVSRTTQIGEHEVGPRRLPKSVHPRRMCGVPSSANHSSPLSTRLLDGKATTALVPGIFRPFLDLVHKAFNGIYFCEISACRRSLTLSLYLSLPLHLCLSMPRGAVDRASGCSSSASSGSGGSFRVSRASVDTCQCIHLYIRLYVSPVSYVYPYFRVKL